MNKKLEEWSKLTTEEKLIYNGYDGFCKNESFRQTTVFNKKSKPSEEFRW